jgi:hypothetical protein
MVAASNALSLSIYAVGAYVLSGFGALAVLLYLLYCLWLEFRVLQRSCVNCVYYRRTCCFGKGKICSSLFKKGDPKKFAAWEITWGDMLPDFMVSLLPLLGGVILLVKDFTWTILAAMAALLILSFAGNAAVRGQLACRHCKQRILGCPAEKLFQKGK